MKGQQPPRATKRTTVTPTPYAAAAPESQRALRFIGCLRDLGFDGVIDIDGRYFMEEPQWPVQM